MGGTNTALEALTATHGSDSGRRTGGDSRQRMAAGHTETMATVRPARHLLRARCLARRSVRRAPLGCGPGCGRPSVAEILSRQFKQAFGESPHQYLLTRRLERAAALLGSTDWSVADICYAVGARSVGSFTSSFVRMFGRPPLAYRAAYPPAQRHIRIPRCIALAYGRPQNRTFQKTARITTRSVPSVA